MYLPTRVPPHTCTCHTQTIATAVALGNSVLTALAVWALGGAFGGATSANVFTVIAFAFSATTVLKV